MKYGSLFSGIEAASVAWQPLGWECAWVAEIDPFASAVLAHRYPHVRNLGDVNEIDPDEIEPVDLVVFGSPCQSFSVAGKRLGLDDPRGNMALVALRLVDRIRPRWVVFENVPGLLSSDEGRDFGVFLGLLGECGYGWAYAVLDAQHFGVPQRRRRVFVVGYSGDWRPAAAVLFEPESLRGDPAPRREAGENAPTIPARSSAGGGLRTDFDCDGGLIAACWTARDHKGPDSDTKPGHLLACNIAAQLTTGGGKPGEGYPAIAFKTDQEPEAHGDIAPTLQQPSPSGGGQPTAVMTGMSVRRLTPRECERLQGMPDDWTRVPYRGKPAQDGPRYRAIGNSMAVLVVRWIGRRIQQFEDTA